MTQWDDPRNDPTRRYPPPEYGEPQYGPPYGNPPYGNPPYGRPEYGQPYGTRPGYGQPPPNPFGTEGDQAFGIVGTVLALLGLVALLVSLLALEWFSNDVFAGGASFSDVGNALDNGNGNGFASAYFGWLAWVFLIVTVVSAVLASFPSPALRALRTIGVVVGIAAAGLSFLAVDLDGGSYGHYIGGARVGFYLAVLGYLLAGIGAGIGPRKV